MIVEHDFDPHGGRRPSVANILRLVRLCLLFGGRYGHLTSGGMLDRIELTFPPVFSPKIVPRS